MNGMRELHLGMSSVINMAHYARVENNIVQEVIVADKEFVDSFDTTPILTNAVQRRLDSLPEIDLSLHKDRQLIGYNYLEYVK